MDTHIYIYRGRGSSVLLATSHSLAIALHEICSDLLHIYIYILSYVNIDFNINPSHINAQTGRRKNTENIWLFKKTFVYFVTRFLLEDRQTDVGRQVSRMQILTSSTFLKGVLLLWRTGFGAPISWIFQKSVQKLCVLKSKLHQIAKTHQISKAKIETDENRKKIVFSQYFRKIVFQNTSSFMSVQVLRQSYFHNTSFTVIHASVSSFNCIFMPANAQRWPKS